MAYAVYVEYDNGSNCTMSDWVISSRSFDDARDLIAEGREDEDVFWNYVTYQAGFEGTWPECDIFLIQERFHLDWDDAKEVYDRDLI